MAKHEYDRPVTEFDFRAKEFQHPDIKPEDYEFRSDGVLVRKDRWERAVRQLARTREFEIGDVVDKCLTWEKAYDCLLELRDMVAKQVQAGAAPTMAAMSAMQEAKHLTRVELLELIDEQMRTYEVGL